MPAPDEDEQPAFRVRYGKPLIAFPFVAGVVTAMPLWGDKAEPLFFSTAAEVIALGAIAMALQGRFFRVDDEGGGNYGIATILISVGVGLAFAFGALVRGDGGTDPHLAMTAGALAMGVSHFAIQALFGPPGVEREDAQAAPSAGGFP